MKKKQERCRDIVAREDSALNIWNFLPLGKTFFHQDRRSVSVLWIASSQNLRHTSAELQQRFCDNGFDILILWRARYSQCYYLKGNGSDQVTEAFHVLLNYCSHLYKAAFIYMQEFCLIRVSLDFLCQYKNIWRSQLVGSDETLAEILMESTSCLVADAGSYWYRSIFHFYVGASKKWNSLYFCCLGKLIRFSIVC